jgi:hypothetical protein
MHMAHILGTLGAVLAARISSSQQLTPKTLEPTCTLLDGCRIKATTLLASWLHIQLQRCGPGLCSSGSSAKQPDELPGCVGAAPAVPHAARDDRARNTASSRYLEGP